ncbi:MULTISPECIES: class A beta-lactamase [Streptomyces]|uniref:class A beta-lactamase n=1 Tax=Streptomyces TaxID=1883 RepID=UPI00143202A3|nr:MULTISPECIES: class A beta-lactamase [Streptomyces]NIL49862.1 class A beta-lactamase [Streptomyces sp. 2BBP-J2]GHG06701.1 beta-lactamase [Streptomyces viridodiastaticus]
MTARLSRRSLLLTAALAPVAGCATDAPDRVPASGASATAGRGTPSPVSPRNLAALEREYGARLGVFAVDTGTGATVVHRADERFALCSTFKTLAAAAVLDRRPGARLDERIPYGTADLVPYSPVTEKHTGEGMTLRQLCDAAVRYSDNTAANLLLRDIGGPRGLTAYARRLGDRVTRLDHTEPELNSNPPGDPRDTTTPRAIAADHRALVLGDALPAAGRALLTDWLVRNTTGDRRIRAGAPRGWRVGDKTGSGDWGRGNDVAVLWPGGGRPPLVLSVLTERPDRAASPSDELVAEAARRVLDVLR